MSFEEILAELNPFFLQHGYSVAQVRQGYICYASAQCEIAIGYDRGFISVFFGNRNLEASVELTPEVRLAAFKDDSQLLFNSSFSKNLIKLFSIKANRLFYGDPRAVEELKQYWHAINSAYHQALMNKQEISQADEAWDSKEYGAFINIIDRMDKSNLPKSYLLKYQMAKKKAISP